MPEYQWMCASEDCQFDFSNHFIVFDDWHRSFMRGDYRKQTPMQRKLSQHVNRNVKKLAEIMDIIRFVQN